MNRAIEAVIGSLQARSAATATASAVKQDVE
jgi:hypothetical protein